VSVMTQTGEVRPDEAGQHPAQSYGGVYDVRTRTLSPPPYCFDA
jgi:hypothetical protein